MLGVLPPSRATNFHVADSRCRFYFLQHKNLLREKVVIRATNNHNLQRQHCCATSCTKMLPVLLGLNYKNNGQQYERDSQKFSNNLVEKAFAILLQAFNIFLELASDSANYYGFSVLEHTVKSLCSRPFELKFVRLTHGYIICMAGKLVSGNSAIIIKSGLRTNQLKF